MADEEQSEVGAAWINPKRLGQMALNGLASDEDVDIAGPVNVRTREQVHRIGGERNRYLLRRAPAKQSSQELSQGVGGSLRRLLRPMQHLWWSWLVLRFVFAADGGEALAGGGPRGFGRGL